VLILPKLTRVVFWCNNLKRVRKFYEEMLGFEVHNVDPNAVWVSYKNGPFRFAFMEGAPEGLDNRGWARSSSNPNDGENWEPFTTVTVEDLRTTWEKLKATGFRTLTLNNPEKNSNPRIFKLSEKLLTMLNSRPMKFKRVFGYTSLTSMTTNFGMQRNRIAKKLGNPRIRRIHFHTLRHWKATMEYHKTKDILYVQQLLGHKNIQNTLIYTQLINFESDEFHVKTAKTVDEACKLVEAGFDYVTTMDNCQIFRKRK